MERRKFTREFKLEAVRLPYYVIGTHSLRIFEVHVVSAMVSTSRGECRSSRTEPSQWKLRPLGVLPLRGPIAKLRHYQRFSRIDGARELVRADIAL
jgi:hypothetical protein